MSLASPVALTAASSFKVEWALLRGALGLARKRPQSGRRWPEAAFAEVEPAVLFIEIDMKPRTSGGARFLCRDIDESSAYAMPLNSCAHARVDDESMNGTVPRHVDEADQLLAVPCCHPAEAVRPHLSNPIDGQEWMGEGLCVQGIQFLVREFTAPLKMMSSHERSVIAGALWINPLVRRRACPTNVVTLAAYSRSRRRGDLAILVGAAGDSTEVTSPAIGLRARRRRRPSPTSPAATPVRTDVLTALPLGEYRP